MLKRVNFYLSEIQIKRLIDLSKKTGLSMSEILRRAIDEYWERQKGKRRRKLRKEGESRKGKSPSHVIKENISIAEAPSFGKTIFEHKADSNGAEDYSALSKEIIERG